MKVGVDFDNTIVCYDGVFYRAAIERHLIPLDTPMDKNSIRDHLRGQDREDLWTELQGYVYGLCMEYAEPYTGVMDFFKKCKLRGLSVFIVSHRTRYPYIGEKYDLHRSAYEWLFKKGLIGPSGILSPEEVFMEVTAKDKIKRIWELGCDVFIDDLPEFLNREDFPESTKRILFDPRDSFCNSNFLRAKSWEEIDRILFGRG